MLNITRPEWTTAIPPARIAGLIQEATKKANQPQKNAKTLENGDAIGRYRYRLYNMKLKIKIAHSDTRKASTWPDSNIPAHTEKIAQSQSEPKRGTGCLSDNVRKYPHHLQQQLEQPSVAFPIMK